MLDHVPALRAADLPQSAAGDNHHVGAIIDQFAGLGVQARDHRTRIGERLGEGLGEALALGAHPVGYQARGQPHRLDLSLHEGDLSRHVGDERPEPGAQLAGMVEGGL